MLFIVALFGMRRQGIVQLDVAFVCTDLLRKSNLIYKWIIAIEMVWTIGDAISDAVQIAKIT